MKGEGGYTVHANGCTCPSCLAGPVQEHRRRIKLLETKIVEMGQAWSTYVRATDDKLALLQERLDEVASNGHVHPDNRR